ncbi:hypothetical protein Aduo_012519 [Ancylostoma duodenale]
MDDLNDFLITTERDGELLSEICSMFNTDVLQVRDVLGEIQQLQNSSQSRSQSAHEEKMDVSQGNEENGETHHSTDWSSLRTALEAAFGAMGQTGHGGQRGERKGTAGGGDHMLTRKGTPSSSIVERDAEQKSKETR